MEAEWKVKGSTKAKRKLIKQAKEMSKILNNSAIYWKETVDDLGNTFCQCGLREEDEESSKEKQRCKTDKHDDDKTPRTESILRLNECCVLNNLISKNAYNETFNNCGGSPNLPCNCVISKQLKENETNSLNNEYSNPNSSQILTQSNTLQEKSENFSSLNLILTSQSQRRRIPNFQVAAEDIDIPSNPDSASPNTNTNTNSNINYNNNNDNHNLNMNINLNSNSISAAEEEINQNSNLNNFNNFNNFNNNTEINRNSEINKSLESESRKVWTPEEDEILINFVKTKPKKNWKELANILKNKTSHQCIYRFKKLQKELIFKKWSKQEDILLLDLIEKHGQNWALFAGAHFPTRTAEELEERYCSKLNPNLKRSNFDAAEDELIIQLYSKFGNKWNEIAKHFKDRNAHMIKNRYYSHIKKKLRVKDGILDNSRASKDKSRNLLGESDTITETSSFTSLSNGEQERSGSRARGNSNNSGNSSGNNNAFLLSNGSSVGNRSNSNLNNSGNNQSAFFAANNNFNLNSQKDKKAGNLNNQNNIFFFGGNISNNNLSWNSNSQGGSDCSGNSSRINIFQKNQMINFNSNYDFDYNINMNLEQQQHQQQQKQQENSHDDKNNKMQIENELFINVNNNILNGNMNKQINHGNNNINFLNEISDENSATINQNLNSSNVIATQNQIFSPSKALKNGDSLNVSNNNNFNLNDDYRFINDNLNDFILNKNSSFINNLNNISNILPEINSNSNNRNTNIEINHHPKINYNNENLNELKEIEMNIDDDQAKANNENAFTKEFNFFETDELDLDKLLLDFDRIDKFSTDSFNKSYDVLLDNEMNLDLNYLYSINEKLIFDNMELNDKFKRLSSLNLNFAAEELNVPNKINNNKVISNRSSIETNTNNIYSNNNFNLSGSLSQNELTNYSDNYANNYFFNKMRSNSSHNNHNNLHKNKEDLIERRLSDNNINVNKKINGNNLSKKENEDKMAYENQNKKAEDEENKINFESKNSIKNKKNGKSKPSFVIKKEAQRKTNSLNNPSKSNSAYNSNEKNKLKNLIIKEKVEKVYTDSPQLKLRKSLDFLNENKFMLRKISYDEREYTYVPKELIKFQIYSRTNSGKSQTETINNNVYNNKESFQSNYEKIFFENKEKFMHENFEFTEDDAKRIDLFIRKNSKDKHEKFMDNDNNEIKENVETLNYNFIGGSGNSNNANTNNRPEPYSLFNKFESLEKILNNFMEINSKQIQISDIPLSKNNEKQIEKFMKADKKINEKREMLFNKLMEVKGIYFNLINNNYNKNNQNENMDLRNDLIQFLGMQMHILVKLIKATKIKISLAAKLEKYVVNTNA